MKFILMLPFKILWFLIKLPFKILGGITIKTMGGNQGFQMSKFSR